MTDDEIKHMLNALQQDLASQPADTAEWTHAEFIPLEKRQRKVNILTAGHWIGQIMCVAFAAYFLHTFQDNATIQRLFVGFVSGGLLVQGIAWYKFVRPQMLANEYTRTRYRLNFKKEKLEIWHNNQKTAQHKFHAAGIILPPLPLPKAAFDQDHYRMVQQKCQQNIQNRTGFVFR